MLYVVLRVDIPYNASVDIPYYIRNWHTIALKFDILYNSKG